MTRWRRFDPRLHLGAAVGWTVFVVVVLAALVAADLAARETELRERVSAQRLLAQFATQIERALAMNVATRHAIVQATAAQIVASGDLGDAALRRHLETVQAQFPEFAWLGVADARGRIEAATGGESEGRSVAGEPWYRQGRERAFTGEVRAAPAPGRTLAAAVAQVAASPFPSPSLGFIEMAVPLTVAPDRDTGVLGARLSWAWVDRLQASLLHSLQTPRRLDLLLAGADGTVRVGPPAWLGAPLPDDTALSDGGAFLVGRHAEPAHGAAGNAWMVVVRQEAAAAVAPAQSTRRWVFLTVLLAGLVAALLSVGLTRLLLRRLGWLAAQAHDVRRGARSDLAVPPGRDEVSRIGATLAELVAHLQRDKRALQILNAELDARVAERTARIERLAEDARHAAVTRERLRVARDLHDTLAHSLMALLTQIRLVRKLRHRLPESELEAELERAESVAASGLTEARAAITQMRHNGVRDTGLGPALRELLGRFRERSGIAASLQADPLPAGLADERAETVFRIVEEALHNVEQHARAQAVRVLLDRQPLADEKLPSAGAPARLRVDIADDGVGFDPTVPVPGHYGLSGIREQAALIGADLAVTSRPGHGTRIVLTFDA